MIAKLDKNRKLYKGVSNTKELNCILSSLMIRRLKKDVLKELPPKIRQKIEVETQQSYIDELKEIFGINKDVRMTEEVLF